MEQPASSAQPVNRTIPIAAFVLVVLGVVGSIVFDGGPSTTGGPTEPRARHGQDIYRKVCQECHNLDPKLDGVGGTVPGPAIADSSLELLQARVLRKEYPTGYKPKRDTQLMPPRPELELEIPALHAFLVWSRQ